MVGFAESSSSMGAGCAGSAAFGESRVAPMRSKRPSALSLVAKQTRIIAGMLNFETRADCYELSQRSLPGFDHPFVVSALAGILPLSLKAPKGGTTNGASILERKRTATNYRSSPSLFMD